MNKKNPSCFTEENTDEPLKGMAYIPEGELLMGTEIKKGCSNDKEGPVRNVNMKPFYIDKTTVSNKEFTRFIKDTNYVTDAEKYGWSFVFYKFLTKKQINQSTNLNGVSWWYAVKKANWRQPEGEKSNINKRLNHPVVHISWNDAIEFCKWAQKRLHTEAEWEYAARGGLKQKKYPWGNELTPNGVHYCNIWQGDFPSLNTKRDGYIGTAPVDSYFPNGYGLFNVSGNVWEWCSNKFEENAKITSDNYNQATRAIRGGSYLCHHSYCNRYRIAARSFNTEDSSTGNMGFRCVRDI